MGPQQQSAPLGSAREPSKSVGSGLFIAQGRKQWPLVAMEILALPVPICG